MKYLSLLIFLLVSISATASDYTKEINEFFDLYKKGKIDKAVDTIYQSNPYVSSIPDQIKKVKTQLGAVEGLVGKLHTLELVDTYEVGTSLVHVTYMGIYDRQPVKFEFQFFKLNDGWRIYSFSFDAEVFDKIEVMAQKRAFESNK
jgi:hypothetical protein